MKFLYVAALLAVLFCSSVSGRQKKLYDSYENEYDLKSSPSKLKAPPIPQDGQIYRRDASNVLPATTFNETIFGNSTRNCDPSEPLVRNLTDGSMLSFFHLDFGVGQRLLHLRYSSFNTVQTQLLVQVFLDQPEHGELISEFTIRNTQGWCSFTERRLYLLRIAAGVRHVFFLFHGPPAVKVLDLSFIQFTNDVTACLG